MHAGQASKCYQYCHCVAPVHWTHHDLQADIPTSIDFHKASPNNPGVTSGCHPLPSESTHNRCMHLMSEFFKFNAQL
jgi:hypothetical protein